MTLPLAHRIAAHLPGWHVTTEHDVSYLVRADGARIVIPAWRQRGRVSFVGCWPRYADGSNYYATRDRFEITCSETRSPEAMARDIQRRLLPGYDPAFAEALAFVEKHDGFAGDASTVARRIAAVVGGEVVPQRRSGDAVHVRAPAASLYRLTVSPAYESTTHAREMGVSFEVHALDPETAAEVLAVIAAADARREEEAARVRVVAPVRVVETVDEAEDEEREAEDGRKMVAR